MTDQFQPIYDEIIDRVEANPILSNAFDQSNGSWIAYGLPPVDPEDGKPNGPLPCIRLDGVGSTNNGTESEHTGVLSIWTEGGDTEQLVNLARSFEGELNHTVAIHCSGYITRQEGGLGRAVYPIRFYL